MASRKLHAAINVFVFKRPQKGVEIFLFLALVPFNGSSMHFNPAHVLRKAEYTVLLTHFRSTTLKSRTIFVEQVRLRGVTAPNLLCEFHGSVGI